MSQHHTALVHTMVLVSAADRDMTDPELQTIGEIVSHLPVFADYDLEQLPREAEACAADGAASQEELRLLEMLRHRLAVGRLPAAAIERGTRARYMRL